MSPGEAVLQALVDAQGVTVLVGRRIYPVQLPEKATFPAVVVTGVSQVPESTFTSTPADEISGSRVQVDVYAKQYDDAHQIAEAIEDVLCAPPIGGIKLDSRELFETNTRLARVNVDFSIWRGR